MITNEADVPDYNLPEVLRSEKGQLISDPQAWWQVRRPEILAQLEREMFGHTPPELPVMRVELRETSRYALAGLATRKQIRIHYGPAHAMDLLLYQPNHLDGPYPVLLGLNFQGNHSIHSEPDIFISESWMPDIYAGVTEHRASEACGAASGRWPLELILRRGYALATAYCGDLDPDFDDGFQNGVHSLYPRQGSDAWGTIGAWAWGLSRALDYLETDDELDKGRVAVLGHSRLGKAALWAGTQDQRFALVISNDSGCGGAALSRRRFGETVAAINDRFPHWFCENFRAYNDNEDALPFDQHHLLALIAPRPLYVASAAEDLWADPRGEFLSAVHAGDVYRFLGAKGLPRDEMPPLETPLLGGIGYHLRSGPHNITPYDWGCYLNFADQAFQHRST